ncbi:phage Gp37/Gp68 family protein [Actinomadura meridiana]|uniref:Phage Gp37/Gp68 family protein n=1 Tax=Actinomadura meridiana TaxID=559626 RepID=A0ABP8BUY1_9ACTN
MSDATKIEWSDASWNPVTGCTKVSPGCDHCYAETFAERWRGTPGHHFENGFDLTLRPERLDQPIRWTKPRKIFVNSMSDLFHKDVPTEFIAHMFAVMALTPQHTYQVLTKRHARMRALMRKTEFRAQVARIAVEMTEAEPGPPYLPEHLVVTCGRSWWPLPNVWLGVSVENQTWANIRVPALLDAPAAVRWISAEPLLGPLDLSRWLVPEMSVCQTDGHPETMRALAELGRAVARNHGGWSGLGWVVTGGESGPGARPAHPDWFRSIRDQCQNAGVAYLHKQNGAWVPVGPLYGDSDEVDDAHMEAVCLEVNDRKRVVQLERSGHVADDYQPTDPRTWLMARVGKKAAGRELDGRTWDQYPDGAR